MFASQQSEETKMCSISCKIFIFQDSVCHWLETSLKSLQQNSNSSMTTVATDKQLAEFHRSVTSAECAPDVSHALREFARLWR